MPQSRFTEIMSDSDTEEARRRRQELNEELIEAARSGNAERVTRALEEGAEITSTDSVGDTGLHLSAWMGHDSVTRMFLERGINVNIRGWKQVTALIKAAELGKITSLTILLDNNADPDLKDDTGETALMKAAARDNVTSLRIRE